MKSCPFTVPATTGPPREAVTVTGAGVGGEERPRAARIAAVLTGKPWDRVPRSSVSVGRVVASAVMAGRMSRCTVPASLARAMRVGTGWVAASCAMRGVVGM